MPNLQSASADLSARIAEYVAQMDAEEAAAYRRADKEQREIDATQGGGDVPARRI